MPDKTNAIVEFRSVAYSIDGAAIIEDLNFEVHSCEILVLLGEFLTLQIEQFAGQCLEAIGKILAELFQQCFALVRSLRLFLQTRRRFGQPLFGALTRFVAARKIQLPKSS